MSRWMSPVRTGLYSERLSPPSCRPLAGWCTSSTITGVSRSCPRRCSSRFGEKFRRDIRGLGAGQRHPADPVLRAGGPQGRRDWHPTWRLAAHGRPLPGGGGSAAPRSSSWCGTAAQAGQRDPGGCPQFLLHQGTSAGCRCFYVYILSMSRWARGSSRSGTYFPYPVKVWVNGHEWAKRQGGRRRDRLHPRLSNGFASCEDPAALQDILRPVRPGHGGQCGFERWMARIPLPAR